MFDISAETGVECHLVKRRFHEMAIIGVITRHQYYLMQNLLFYVSQSLVSDISS